MFFPEEISATPVVLFSTQSPRGGERDSVSEIGVHSEASSARSEGLGVDGGVSSGAHGCTHTFVAQCLLQLSSFRVTFEEVRAAGNCCCCCLSMEQSTRGGDSHN